MIKAILFDLGEVIYHQPKKLISEVITKVYNQPYEVVYKEYGKYDKEYFIGKLKADDLIKALNKTFKCSKSIDEIKKNWLKTYAGLIKANGEVLKIIKELKKNYKVFLFSNSTEMSHEHNRMTGIYDYFHGIFLSHQVGHKKPEKGMYEKAIADLKLRPEEILFIDNSEENIKAAKQIGIKTILFSVVYDKVEKLKQALEKHNLI